MVAQHAVALGAQALDGALRRVVEVVRAPAHHLGAQRLERMKNILLLLMLITSLCVQAQQQYVIEKDIHYYADSINKKDAYISSQCTLDIYYPRGSKNYATIVWFHGCHWYTILCNG